MKLGKLITTAFLMLVLMVMPVAAQTELPDPGMTPDHPLYFLDELFDNFQSSENVADEKAAEMIAMAQANKAKALEKARSRYEKAMEKRNTESQEDEATAEEVARQASNHMAALATARQEAPEEAQAGLEKAIKNSAQGREEALNNLEEKNPERGKSVALATLQEVLANSPEAAKEGLQNAIENVRKNVPPTEGSEEAKARGNRPENRANENDTEDEDEDDRTTAEREAAKDRAERAREANQDSDEDEEVEAESEEEDEDAEDAQDNAGKADELMSDKANSRSDSGSDY